MYYELTCSNMLTRKKHMFFFFVRHFHRLIYLVSSNEPRLFRDTNGNSNLPMKQKEHVQSKSLKDGFFKMVFQNAWKFKTFNDGFFCIFWLGLTEFTPQSDIPTLSPATNSLARRKSHHWPWSRWDAASDAAICWTCSESVEGVFWCQVTMWSTAFLIKSDW